MANGEEQLSALRELLWQYSQAKLWGAPRRFEYVGAQVKRCADERRQLQREMTQAHIKVMQRLHTAQKRLLATGYPVPDSWLTVRTIGQTSTQHTASRKGQREKVVLSDSGADMAALDAVCREMSAAAIRLEARIEPAAAGNADSAAPIQQPAESHDVPLTLREFIQMHCVSEKGGFSDDRLDALAKAIQSAARRYPGEVQLPSNVGTWRPGQKRYYLPSKLREVWPQLMEHLAYLPDLKS